MLSGIEQLLLRCYPLFVDALGLFPRRGRGLRLPDLGLGEGQELFSVGERPREPWLRVVRLLVGPGARGPRCAGVTGSLLGFSLGIGPGRWGLNVILTPGVVLRSVDVNFRTGRWGLNVVITLSAVPRPRICING